MLPFHRGVSPPVEILVNWRRKPARCVDCTNVNCILTESWGCGEVKNVVLQSVQTAYKLQLATKPMLPFHHSVASPMEILVNWGRKPARCVDCTNVNCILTESWGCGEVKNVVLQSVQTAYKLLRATKPMLPFYRSVAPPVEILVNWRLQPARCDDCTNANCILTEAKAVDRLKMWFSSRCKQRTNFYGPPNPCFSFHRGVAPPGEILVNWRRKPARCDDCTNANCILTASWGCG